MDYEWTLDQDAEMKGGSEYNASESRMSFELIIKKLNDKAKTRFVSLYEVKKKLGFELEYITASEQFYLNTYGWGGSQPGLHFATSKDLHPDRCPCCGRPWDE